MISICTAAKSNMDKWIDVLVKSIQQHSSLVSEVLVCYSDINDGSYQEKKEGSLVVKRFAGAFCSTLPLSSNFPMEDYHPCGLMESVRRAQGEYILTTDVDVFWYMPVDKFYVDLVDKHKLDWIGCSHYSPTVYCWTYCPHVINMMFRRDKLPQSDFLSGYIRTHWGKAMDGEWFLCCSKKGMEKHAELLEQYGHLYKNPDGAHDVGEPLFLWAELNKWRWLSFQTGDTHIYKPCWNRSNCLPTLKYPARKKLLYHQTSSAKELQPLTRDYFAEFEASEEEES